MNFINLLNAMKDKDFQKSKNILQSPLKIASSIFLIKEELKGLTTKSKSYITGISPIIATASSFTLNLKERAKFHK